MQILVAALIAVLVLLQYYLWVEEDGVRQTQALRISIQAQTEENEARSERNRGLEADIKDLKTGLVAIEERARSEMGMIRQDETFYRLLEQPASSSTTQLKSAPSAPPTQSGLPLPTPLSATNPSIATAKKTTAVKTAISAKPAARARPASAANSATTRKPTVKIRPTATAKPTTKPRATLPSATAPKPANHPRSTGSPSRRD